VGFCHTCTPLHALPPPSGICTHCVHSTCSPLQGGRVAWLTGIAALGLDVEVRRLQHGSVKVLRIFLELNAFSDSEAAQRGGWVADERLWRTLVEKPELLACALGVLARRHAAGLPILTGSSSGSSTRQTGSSGERASVSRHPAPQTRLWNLHGIHVTYLTGRGA
jgi:hypothetical protein